MPEDEAGDFRRYPSVEALSDPHERRLELARVTGMRSPLTFHERKARRILSPVTGLPATGQNQADHGRNSDVRSSEADGAQNLPGH